MEEVIWMLPVVGFHVTSNSTVAVSPPVVLTDAFITPNILFHGHSSSRYCARSSGICVMGRLEYTRCSAPSLHPPEWCSRPGQAQHQS